MNSIVRKINRWCSIISAVSLSYNVAVNYFFRGYSLEQSFALDPIGYVTTFLPIIVEIVFNTINIVRDKNCATKIARIIIKPIAYVGISVFEVFIIFYFKMNVGFNIEPNFRFLFGIFILMLFAVAEAFILALCEGEDTIDVFTGRTFWITWSMLSLINGASEANVQISNYVSLSSAQVPIAWLCIAVICTLIFFVWLMLYAIIILVSGIITGFSM